MKVTIHAGVTMLIGPANSNQYARIDVTYADIDPTLPLEPQISQARRTVREGFKALLRDLDEQVEGIFKRRPGG